MRRTLSVLTLVYLTVSYMNHARKTFADVAPDVQDQGLPHHLEYARPVRVAVVSTPSLLRAIVGSSCTDAGRNLHHGTRHNLGRVCEVLDHSSSFSAEAVGVHLFFSSEASPGMRSIPHPQPDLEEKLCSPMDTPMA